MRTFMFLLICVCASQALRGQPTPVNPPTTKPPTTVPPAPPAPQRPAQPANPVVGLGALTTGAVVTGTLQGYDGTLIAGASVTLSRMPPYPEGTFWKKDWFVTSGTAGTFLFDGIYPGTYRLCAQAPAGVWLNPCQWGPQPSTVFLSSAQQSLSATIVLKKGVAVPIHVNDPGQWLAQNEGKTPGAHLLLGVANDAFVFEPAAITSQNSTGRNYSVVIPFATSVNLIVSSSFFQLSDATGTPLPRTGSTAIPITVSNGQQPTTLTLTVTGGGR
jgi:hypothetical protein